MQGGKWEQQQTFCSSQSGAPVAARATSVFLKGNVITLLINTQSDRTICHEQASAAAVAVILSLGFVMRSRGKDLMIAHGSPAHPWAAAERGQLWPARPTAGPALQHLGKKRGRKDRVSNNAM